MLDAFRSLSEVPKYPIMIENSHGIQRNDAHPLIDDTHHMYNTKREKVNSHAYIIQNHTKPFSINELTDYKPPEVYQ